MDIEATDDLDNGINELPDLSMSKCTADDELCAASPKDIGTTTEPDNGISQLPNPSSQPQDSLPPPLSAPAAASPVVNPLSKSPPSLSQSMIKLAIENIVETGDPTINSEVIAINFVGTSDQSQNLSKQGRKTTMNTSKSKKRTREEGGPSEDMPKTQRARVSVPPHEQSSRYDNDSLPLSLH